MKEREKEKEKEREEEEDCVWWTAETPQGQTRGGRSRPTEHPPRTSAFYQNMHEQKITTRTGGKFEEKPYGKAMKI